MSSVVISMTTQPKDGGQSNYGSVNLSLNIQGVVYPLNLALSAVSGYEKFREVIYFTGQGFDSDRAQAETYLEAFRRDYSHTGGTKNISATVDTATDEITLTAKVGTFSSGAYTGNILQSVSFSYDNTFQEDPKTFTFEATGEGSCTTERYRVLGATGGASPYRLVLRGTNILQNWDGVDDIEFNLNRNTAYSGGLYDAGETLIKAVSINPTKNIKASDFKQRTTAYFGYADLRVERVIERAGTDPLEYDLVDSQDNARGWQSSNVFGAVDEGTYTLKIKDKYSCQVSKVISVRGAESPLQDEREDYFAVSEYNSVSFYNKTEHDANTRKNYYNTPSHEERVGLPKNGIFQFPAGRTISTQFRSSATHHRVTLFRYGVGPVALDFTEIQQNLGVAEKVDCKLFLVSQDFEQIGGGTITISSGTGIYFEGGTQFQPNTTNPLDDPSSPYDGDLPPWALVGAFVQLDGLGTFEITETDLYDELREVYYFKIAERFPEQDARVQAIYDRHPYNIFRFDFSSDLLPEKGAFLRIEPGVLDGADFLVNTNFIHQSEWMGPISDTSKYTKFSWSAFRNIGYMSFIDGIQCELWVKGTLRPISSSSAEIDDAVDTASSVDQKSYLRMRGTFPFLTPKHWRKIDLVMAIGSRGQVFVEDLELIRSGTTEQNEIEQTNASTLSIEFALSGESNAIGQEDPVYSLDTGLTEVPDISGKTGRPGVEGWQVNGNRLTTEEGEWVKVDDNGTEKYVEIN